MPGEVDQGTQDPIAQGQQTAAETPETVVQDQQPNGVEKRIAELVAAQHEWQRKFQAQEEQNQQLMSLLLQQQQQGPRAQPQDPYAGVELDPDDRKKIEAVISPQLKQLQEMQRQMQFQFELAQVQQAASVYGDPRITELSVRLLQDWRQKGFSGWTPADAVDHAMGLLAKTERAKRTGQGAPAEIPPSVVTQQSLPATMRQPAGRLSSNFDNLSTDQQIALLEKEGLDDLPL